MEANFNSPSPQTVFIIYAVFVVIGFMLTFWLSLKLPSHDRGVIMIPSRDPNMEWGSRERIEHLSDAAAAVKSMLKRFRKILLMHFGLFTLLAIVHVLIIRTADGEYKKDVLDSLKRIEKKVNE